MEQYGGGGGYGWPEGPPQSLQDYYKSVEEGSNRRFDLTLGESRAARQADLKAKMAGIDMQYKIAKLNAQTESERLAVDKWYKEQQTRIADETLKENVRQFDKQYGLNEADLTGFYGGNPTLAREKWQADATGYVNGQETLQREELRRRFGLDERTADRRFGLDEGNLTGMYGGQQTLEAQELARRFGLDQEKFGLNVAQTAADLRSRPDMQFQYQQFARSLPGLLAGQGGQAPAQGTGPQGQTIQGQLAEVGYPPSGYLQPAMSTGGGGAAGAGAAPYGPGPQMYHISGSAGGSPGVPDQQQQAAGNGSPAGMGYLSYAAPDLSSDPTLQALGKTYQSGFRKLGAQSLEGMDDNEAGFLKSAGTYLGYDPAREARSYARSRLGQSTGGGY